MKEEMKKKKSIALQVAVQEESEDSSKEEENESDIALLARKLRKFMRKKKLFPKKKTIDRGELEKVKELVICYKCKTLGHYRLDCTLLKKILNKKKKTFMMT